METEPVPSSDPVPVPVIAPALAPHPPPQDTTTLAVLEFLLNPDPKAKTSAWEHLVKILFCTIKPRRGSPRLFLPEGEIAFHPRRVRDDPTRLFLEDWLIVKLKPFHRQSKEEIQAAADGGKFRYWGGDCKNDLKDELRHRRSVNKNADAVKFSSKTSVDPDPLDTHPDRIDRPISEDEDSELWCDRLVSNAPLPGEDDNRHIERDRLLKFIQEHPELALADIEIEMTAFVDCCLPEDDMTDAEVEERTGEVEPRGIDGDVTRRIAELRNVSLVQARTYKRRFLQIAEDRTKNDDPPNPALREFFDLLEKRTTIPNADKER